MPRSPADYPRSPCLRKKAWPEVGGRADAHQGWPGGGEAFASLSSLVDKCSMEVADSGGRKVEAVADRGMAPPDGGDTEERHWDGCYYAESPEWGNAVDGTQREASLPS